MPYREVNLLITNLDALIAYGAVDGFTEASWGGLLAVTSVASFERRIKESFYRLAYQYGPVMGRYMETKYRRLNSHITIGELNDFLLIFGTGYKASFEGELEKLRVEARRHGRPDPSGHYSSLLAARHGFAHEMLLPRYNDIKEYYISSVLVVEAFVNVI